MQSAIKISGSLPTQVDTNTSLGTSDNVVPSQNAVKEYVDSLTLSDRSQIQIAASSTEVADSFAKTEARSIKWEVTVIDTFTLEYSRYQILAVHNDSEVSYNVYGEVGDEILHEPSVVINGDNIEFKIQNDETHYINISMIRIKIV